MSEVSSGPPAKPIRLALITGLSGSGKSTVANCLEDLGYYCIDNLPMPLLRHFLSHPTEQVPGGDRIALVADARTPGLARELPALIAAIDRRAVKPVLLFLESSDPVLVRRFSETRRRHPLAEDAPVIEGIHRERELVADLRGMADLVMDTSELTVHELRGEIYREFGPEGERRSPMTVSLMSFGFKHGIPNGADLLFDVRYLPNPHFVLELRQYSGQEVPILEYLERQPQFPELLDRLEQFLGYLLPHFASENRSYLTVAVGCTGGRHRSVAVCERLGERLRRAEWTVHLVHRDVAR